MELNLILLQFTSTHVGWYEYIRFKRGLSKDQVRAVTGAGRTACAHSTQPLCYRIYKLCVYI